VRAFVLLIYGNATQPNLMDDGEQFRLFAQKRLRPAWRSRAEIIANLRSRESCGLSAAG
jgi:acyl-homoserine-lactone acylase